MAFNSDYQYNKIIDEYIDDDGVEVRVTLKTGTHSWKIPGHGEDRAIQVHVTRNGRYDPISSSIIPVAYMGKVNEAIFQCLL